MVCNEAVRDPQVGADNLDGEIAQPSSAADEIHSVDSGGIDTRRKLSDHKGPQTLFVHRAEERRHFLVEHPVHYGWAVNLSCGQIRCAKDNAKIPGVRAFPYHLYTDCVSHGATR